MGRERVKQFAELGPQCIHGTQGGFTDPVGVLRIVGLYAETYVTSIGDYNWAKARTAHAYRIAWEYRPEVLNWPKGQGMRRWADRRGEKGSEHPKLLSLFRKIVNALSSADGSPEIRLSVPDDDEASEGKPEKRMAQHRRRESRLRKKKLALAMAQNNQRLVCEVPGCGFDFREKYGELGIAFVEIHHTVPLSRAPKSGRKVRLNDLVVVCANCHRMIHRHRECRPIEGLIPRAR